MLLKMVTPPGSRVMHLTHRAAHVERVEPSHVEPEEGAVRVGDEGPGRGHSDHAVVRALQGAEHVSAAHSRGRGSP